MTRPYHPPIQNSSQMGSKLTPLAMTTQTSAQSVAQVSVQKELKRQSTATNGRETTATQARKRQSESVIKVRAALLIF